MLEKTFFSGRNFNLYLTKKRLFLISATFVRKETPF